MAHGPDGCLRWQCDQNINHVNFERAVDQLRETSSESSVAMPTSNTRTKWKEGANVETEGASGMWYWAKITACHDDGTFNVHVYDDETGGQEWSDVRPVNLRSRSQHVQPKGTASRPPKDIPRWDGNDGTAFIEAIASQANDTMVSKSVTNLTNQMTKTDPGDIFFKKSPLSRNRKKSLGFWERKDDSDESDSDHDSTVSGLIEDETKVQNTSARTDTRGNASPRPSKAGSRRSKQKGKPKDAYRRRRKNKNRKNDPRSAPKIVFKGSKDEARPSSSEEGELHPGEQKLQSGVDGVTVDASRMRSNSKGSKFFNKSRRPKAAATTKQTQKHFLGEPKQTQNLSPANTKQRGKHFLGSPKQTQKLSLGSTKNSKKLCLGSPKQTQNLSLSNTKQTENLSLGGTKQIKKHFLGSTKQTQNLGLEHTKQTQNHSLSKIRRATGTVKRMHANVRRSQSDDSVVTQSNSSLGRKNQKETSCKTSLPSAVVSNCDRVDDPNRPGDGGEEPEEQTAPGVNSNGDVSEGKPDSLSPLVLKERYTLDKPLAKFHSTPNLYSPIT